MASCILLAVVLWGPAALAGQIVMVEPETQGQTSPLRERAFDLAIAQETKSILGRSLNPSRSKAVMDILGAERDSLILGYSETASGANATTGSLALDVRVNAERLKARLRDLGVLFTLERPLVYVLRLSGVEPSRTRRLGVLQEVCGLKPAPAGGPEAPVLELSQLGTWTGTLSADGWKSTSTGRTLDQVWFAVWKDYFSRPEVMAQGESGVTFRISGWLSSVGPMEFDKLMDAWTAEIAQKSLVGVEMDEVGMVGVWKVRTPSREGLVRRLEEAVRAQGLRMEIH